MHNTYPVGPIVYYAQISDCTQYVKIGRTVNLNNRIKGFLRDLAKFKLPEEVEILDWYKCESELEAVRLESFLHASFSSLRVINRPYPNAAEYFKLDKHFRLKIEYHAKNGFSELHHHRCPFTFMWDSGYGVAMQEVLKNTQQSVDASMKLVGENYNGG